MQLQFFLYLIPLLLSPIISTVTGIYVWRQRRQSAPGATWLGLLIFATVWWGICYLFQLLAGTDIQTQITWNTLRQVGTNTTAIFLFLFVLEYTGRKEWITRRVLWGLFSIVAAVTLSAFTNEFHHLYWTSYKLAQSGPFQALIVTRGIVNVAYILLNYLLILTSTILLFQWTFTNAQRLYHRQIFAFIIAIMAPWISNFLFISKSILLDLTPFAFTITSLGFAFALFQYRMLDVAPVAHDLIIQEMSDGVIVLDAQNRIVNINPSAQIQAGVKAGEVIGKKASDVFRSWSNLIDQQDPFHNEITLDIGEDKKWLELNSSSIYNQRKILIGRLLILRDITKHKIQDIALHQSEEKYRLIYENLEDVLYQTDFHGILLEISPSIERQTGYTQEELIGSDIREFYPFLEEYEALAAAINEKGLVNDFEVRLRTKNGSIAYVSITVRTIFDSTGQPSRTEGIMRNITERKNIEKELRESETRYRNIFDGIQEAIFVESKSGEILDINQTACDIYGYTRDEFLTKTVRDLVPSYMSLILPGQEEYAASPQEIIETINLRANGEEFPIEISGRIQVIDEKVLRLVIVRDISERKKTAEQLHMQSIALESAANAIVISDKKGMIEWVNPAFTHLTGYTPQEAIGQSTSLLKSGKHDKVFYQNLWGTINSGRVWQGEITNRRKDGTLYVEEQTITPVVDKTGTLLRFIAIKQDVTEQRLAREQLEKQNKYLSVLHQVTLDLLNRRNPADLFQAVVDSAAALLDAPLAEFLLVDGDELVVTSTTANQSNLIGERSTREQAKLSWQAHDTGEPVVLDDYGAWSGRRTDIKSYTGLNATADFPVIVNNKCIAILAVGREKPKYEFTAEEIQTGILFSRLLGLVLDNANLYDSALKEIAERKRTEILLLESEIRFRQIVENASDIIYRADMSGNFTYINPTAMKTFGFTDESQVLGRHFLEFATPASRDELDLFYRKQARELKQNTYFEFLAKTASGKEIWLGQNVQLIMENGQPIGVQAVARDITKLKQAYEALFIARDQAIEASQLKSQLLARVSHELRTPLSGVIGYAELLHHDAFGELSEEQKGATLQIMASTNYLTNIINDLLDEAQIETRSVVLKRESFSPSEMLTKVKNTMSVLAKNKGLKLKTSISPDMPATLTGDVQRLQQIIINLAGNAIKFTSEGEVRINLLRPNSTQWAIQVADTGAGIPQEAQDYIFEPFRQIDNSITRENRGSGLGLSITKQLVELMGGEINLLSEIGRGSTFIITLPIQKITEKKK